MRAQAPRQARCRPWADSSARVSACLLSTCSSDPSNTVIARQPPVTLFSPMLSVVARLTPVSASSESRSTVGPVPVWATARRRVRAGGEVGERPRLVAGRRRRRVNLDADAGDDAEHALGADQQLTQIRARGGLRRPAEVEHARRCDGAQAADHVVETAVARRVLPGRPGRGEAADRRELEALREVPERETAFAEQPFGVGSGDARAEFGLPGHLVERVQFVRACAGRVISRP